MATLKVLRTLRDRRLSRLPLYEDITPSSRWTDDANGRNLIIDLPGFKKEEVNLEIDESGNVIIKGRHGVGNNRFQRLSMTFKAPEGTEMKQIVGNLEGGLYTVMFPKMAVAVAEQEETEPEQKQLDEDKGLDAVLDTESSKTLDKAVIESPQEAVAAQKLAEITDEQETAINKTETITTQKEKTLEKTLESGIPDADTETKTLESPRMEEAATQEQDAATATKPVETAIQELESKTKPAETAGIQELETKTVTQPETNSLSEMVKADESPAPKTATMPADTAIQEHELSMKPSETAAIQELESKMKPAKTVAIQELETKTKPTKTVTQPQTNSLSQILKADESPAPKAATMPAKEKVRPAVKDEAHKHGVKKDGGYLENVMEKIIEHKACIISAILAFSMGILISRKFRS